MQLDIPLSRLKPSKLNPRQHFDEQSLAELTDSIRKDGVLENLIVRPSWTVGTVTQAALSTRAVPLEFDYEIVSGERRYRAALVALSADANVPCRVLPMADPEALRINLTEQLQRNQLTPIEEAEAFTAMLAFRDENGGPLHTVKTLAASVGMSEVYVYERMLLMKLPPRIKKAVNAQEIAPALAKLVARIPAKDLREEVGNLILTGGRNGQAMTRVEAQALIQEKYMVKLSGAPFDQEDADLVPVAGKCSMCPMRTGNNKALFSDVARGDNCTNPSCYRGKCAASFARIGEEAKARGVRVLDDKESGRLFDPHRPAEIRFDCDFVEIDTRPHGGLLKSEVKNPPLWRELAEKAKAAGMAPDVVLAKDGDGRGRYLVNSAPLIAAAEKLGEPIFKGQKGDESELPAPKDGEDANDAFRRGQREHAEKKKADAAEAASKAKEARLVRIAAVNAVHAGLLKEWKLAGIWELVLDMALGADDSAPWTLLIDQLELKSVSSNAEVRAALKKLKAPQRQALVPLLMVARGILDRGVVSEGLRKLAVFADVSLNTVEKETLAKLKPAKAKAKRAVKEPKAAKAA